MNSGFGKLNLKDLGKGCASAIVAGVLLAVVGFFSQPDFNLFTADWIAIGQLAANAAVSAFVGYLGKNLLSTDDGKFLGVIG